MNAAVLWSGLEVKYLGNATKNQIIYSIIDIETTGGKYNEEGVTEIAIYKFDGHEVVDQFISLVNPEKPIQPFVVNLTGINSNMLRNAPKFYEIAKRIIEITTDTIVVAHNASFDYRILQMEFDRLGYSFERQTLCTVELSKKLIPEQDSYSLGKLSRSLGIAVSDRHRASGDAQATVKLFKMLLAKDKTKSIITAAIKLSPRHQMEPKLLDLLAPLPSETGVYYIHNADGDIIYIGKSKNIKKRVNQHFIGTEVKSKKIQLQVADVSFETTGSELVALLKESEEIKTNKPPLNRALRRSIFTHGLFSFEDEMGYVNFQIKSLKNNPNPIATFGNIFQGRKYLMAITEKHQLCQKLTGLYPSKTNCFSYTIKQCFGACLGEESAGTYNARAQSVIDKMRMDNKNILIIDRGRAVDERSVIWVENGSFRGMGFFDLNFQINNPDVLRTVVTPMSANRDASRIIQSFLRRKKYLKIINLEER